MASQRPMQGAALSLRPSLTFAVPTASFGGLLRAYRERALLSQEQLAERAGLSARTIRELEAGRVRRPRGSSVRLLAQALGLRGSLRQAFEAAARPSLSARLGDPARRGDALVGSTPLGGGGVHWLEPSPQDAGVGQSYVLVLSLGDGLAAAPSDVLSQDPMSFQAGGLPRDGLPGDLRGSRVVVVAVAIDLGGRRFGRCRACGRWETG
jgi:transcriptional regulator with XRE-family HTH domain